MTLNLWTKRSPENQIFNFMTVNLNLRVHKDDWVQWNQGKGLTASGLMSHYWSNRSRLRDWWWCILYFLFIPNTLSEKFHYKLLSGPCQSPASVSSNIIQRHLDLATTSSIETILVTVLVSGSSLVITLFMARGCLCPPQLSSPCTLGLRLGWTTASPQNPASKWISHGVTILHVYWIFISHVCDESLACVLITVTPERLVRSASLVCGAVYSSVGTSSPTEYSAPLHRGCRSRSQARPGCSHRSQSRA